MSIQKYIAFLKTIEYGSITEASKALDYSQSGVSRMINDLEEEWNLSLLERGRTGVRLTSDGIRVLPYIKNVCNEYYRLKEEIDSIHNVQTGLIRIRTSFSSLRISNNPSLTLTLTYESFTIPVFLIHFPGRSACPGAGSHRGPAAWHCTSAPCPCGVPCRTGPPDKPGWSPC